jgi:putative glutathione S-transferase
LAVAVNDVFDTMNDLERRLTSQRYLHGSVITESDWRLFPSLVRFDAVYYVLFRCSRRRLVD